MVGATTGIGKPEGSRKGPGRARGTAASSGLPPIVLRFGIQSTSLPLDCESLDPRADPRDGVGSSPSQIDPKYHWNERRKVVVPLGWVVPLPRIGMVRYPTGIDDGTIAVFLF